MERARAFSDKYYQLDDWVNVNQISPISLTEWQSLPHLARIRLVTYVSDILNKRESAMRQREQEARELVSSKPVSMSPPGPVANYIYR